ncbi:MAG: hypothetical protein GC162_13230 [Planctomycetes bacterium]|nr:hypothetical protein [Planctomycetota bacterium]
MRIEPTQSVTPLRIVQPTEPVKSVDAPRSVQSSGPAADMRFEAVYAANLPKVPMTDAQTKLERIRTQLVAAKTDVPIHFDAPASRPRPSNPYAAAYPRLIADPATINANITESKVV